jgi:hypothetical protein
MTPPHDRYARSTDQLERSSRTLAGGVAVAFRTSQPPVPGCVDRVEGLQLTCEAIDRAAPAVVADTSAQADLGSSAT